MAIHQITSDATIKAIRKGDPRLRLTDGGGLYLLLFLNGGSHAWRLDYTFQARRKTLSHNVAPRKAAGGSKASRPQAAAPAEFTAPA